MKTTVIAFVSCLVLAIAASPRPASAAAIGASNSAVQLDDKKADTTVTTPAPTDVKAPKDKPDKSKKNDGKDGNTGDGNNGGGNDHKN